MASHDTALAIPGQMRVVVVTPRREVARQDVTSITAAGANGEVQILPGHIPYLALLRTGVLVLETASGRHVWAHGPGLLEVGAHGHVEVLVEQVAEAGEIDTDAARAELAAVEAELKQVEVAVGATWQNLDARRAWALAQLDAASRA